MKLKSQISLEYVAIVGFTVVLLIFIFIISLSYSRETQDSIALSQVDRIAKNIVDNAESVYYMGSPSRITIKSNIPNRVETISISAKEITFTVRTQNGRTDIHYASAVNLSGSISLSEGLKYIVLEAKEGYVWVTN